MGQYSLSDIEAPASTGKGAYSLDEINTQPSEQHQAGFFESLVNAINPMPALKEWWNRPGELGKAANALNVLDKIHKEAAALPENKGKPVNQWVMPRDLTSDEQETVNRGMSAGLVSPTAGQSVTEHPAMVSAVVAGQQASQGNLRGAAGTLVGGYVVPAAVAKLAEMVPRANSSIQDVRNSAAEHMYQSALKPSTANSIEENQALVRTGLENKIPVSSAGVEKLSGIIEDLNKKVKSQIQSGAQSGATIDPQDVVSGLDKIRSKFSKQVNPQPDLAAIDAVEENFRSGPGAGPIPVDLAQDIKKGTYSQLSKKYGQLGTATIEGEKGLALGVKQALEAQFPEIKPANSELGKAYDLQPVLERAVNRSGNWNLVSLGASAATAAGGAILSGAGPEVSSAAGIAAGVLAKVLDNPAVKSKLATAIYQGSKQAGKPITLSQAMSRVTAYSASLGGARKSARTSINQLPQAAENEQQNPELAQK